MAISKSKIDFDVYQKADPESQIDWGKQAKTITDTFTGIVDEREKKKAAIEKSFQDQQTALNDIGEYDNQTIQQMVMNGGQDVSNKLLDVKNLVQRGLMKPSDATMWQHNAKTGFNLLKKNATSFDKTFVEYTTRLQEKMEGSNLSQGAPGEQWLAQQLEGFAKMNNMTLQADAETGNMVMLRVDEKTGEPIPGESMSVQHMTLLMKQKINNFDVGNYVKDIKTEMGAITTTMIQDAEGPNVVITEEKRSRAEEEFFGTKDGNKFLDMKVQEIFGNPYNAQSMIVNGNLQTSDGTAYEIGSQEDYDKWMTEHNNDEANNPYLVMEFGKDNLYHPKFNEAQEKAAKEYARGQITGALDYSKTQKIQALKTPPQPSAANIAAQRSDEKEIDLGKNVNMMVTGDAKEAEGGMRYLVDASNGQIQNIENTKDGFIITYPDRKPLNISNKGKTADETMRAVWKGVGMETEYDSYIRKGGKVGEITTTDVITVSGPEALVEYDSNTNILNDDGDEVSAIDWVNKTSLGKSLNGMNDSNAEVTKVFTELINKPEFYPKGIGGGKVEMKGDKMTFTIGKTPYDIGDVFAMESSQVVQELQKRIQMEVDKANKGGGVFGDNTGSLFNSTTTTETETNQ